MKKKMLSLLLVLAMLCSLCLPALAVETGLGDLSGKLVILHNNDVHGRTNDFAGYAGIAARAADYRAAGAEVILLDAGDTMHGTPVANLSKGENIVKLLNMVGYAAMAPGNHDFNYGYERAVELAGELKFPVLAANVTYADSGDLVFKDNIVVTAGKYKVGIFGLATVETVTKTDPKNVEGLHFAEGQEMYDIAQKQVDALKALGCDIVVCLGHLGVDGSSAPNRSTDVISHTKGIDLFVDGHSHTAFPTGEPYGDTLLVSTGEYLKNIGQVVYDGKTFTASLLASGDYAARDAAVVAAAKADKDAVTESYGKEIVAVSEVTLDGNRDPGVRTQETNLGDLIADGMMYGAKKAGFSPVAAVVNGGGIRVTRNPGNISMLDIYDIVPFGNNLTVLSLPGSVLDKALEDNVAGLPAAEGGFPQTSGMTYSVDCSKLAGERVTITSIGGQPFDAAKTYDIVTLDFLGRGGDKYAVFMPYFNGVGFSVLDQAVTEYIKEELGGVISAAKYGQPQGRVTVTYPWYKDAAQYVIRGEIMTATGSNLLDPNVSVTRAVVFETLYKMAGKPAVSAAGSFSDVPADAWYANSAAWAKSVGLATGDGAGYAGARTVTRQEIATIFSRYAVICHMLMGEGKALSDFTDGASVASWAKEGVQNSVNMGVINGKDGNRLDPLGTTVRSELAQMLLNYSKLTPAYTETAVSILNGDHEIPGILTMPSGEGPFAAVVMLHGTGSDKHEAGGGYDMAAPELAMAGIASLRIDFMGNGESKADYAGYNYTTAVADADAAAEYLAGLETVDAEAIGVMGWSQGGTIALLAAGKSEVYKSVVTWAGAPDLSLLVTEAGYAAAKKDGFAMMEFDWRPALKVGLQWYEDVKNVDVLKVFSSSKAPVLAINGLNDDVVDPANAIAIVEASDHMSSQTHLIESCDHTFNVFTGNTAAIYDAIGSTAEFFSDTFIPAPPVVQKEVTFAQFTADSANRFFATGKVSYTIMGKTVSATTAVYNRLEGNDYSVAPGGEDPQVILSGTVGEFWVTKMSKVVSTYTKPDGSALTAADFTPDKYVQLKTIAGTGNFACYIPMEYQVEVQTAWGDVLHANRPGVAHGGGDYLVCRAGADGQPDFSDVWVVNGAVFATTYDLTNAK